ncbi:MAG: hypothetical protein AABX71_00440 [Nanoarchaeota archaeon]
MKFSDFLKKVEESPEFKKFKQEHKKAYLCAGFFVLDFEANKNMYQIDFFLPEKKRMATFLIDEEIRMKLSEIMKVKKQAVENLTGKIKIDLQSLKGIVENEMKNRAITQEIKKIIAVLQSQKGKNIWLLNCITSKLDLLKLKISDADSGILEFEKASFFDFIRRIK